MLARGRAAWVVLAAFVGLLGGGSCTDSASDQPVVPASPGASQPEGGGPLVSEDEACDRLRAAEERARTRLVCPNLGRAECPFYVRPAGDGCWRYDSKSIESCEDAIGDYVSCSDFTYRPCVITAVPADDGTCPPLGGGAAGGAGGEPSNGGSGGRGSAGRGGTGGRGGSGGSSPGSSGAAGDGVQGGAGGDSGANN